MKIKGSLTFIVNLNSRTANLKTGDTDNPTVWQHEEKHVQISTKAYNELKFKMDPYEGKYCSKMCTNLAVNVTETYNGYYRGKANRENVEYDFYTYGYRMDVQQKADDGSKLQKFQIQETDNLMMLSGLLAEWLVEGCPK